MILKEFLSKYSSNEACLQKVFSTRYGFKPYCIGCGERRKFTKIKNRPVYQCLNGHQISPLAGTIFAKSSTSLQYWFYAMWLMTATRGGISAKQLERELGVTYKTAWRMAKQIRILMGKRDGSQLKGVVEVDESFWGGDPKNRKYVANFGEKPKEIIMGMVERNGRVIMKHIPNTGKYTLAEQIEKHVFPSAIVMHDQYHGYTNIHKYGFEHESVNHGKMFVREKIIHTENIEGLWGRIKPGIKGVYRKVSPKYIESYMDEYCFRHNNRKKPDIMFDLLLAQI